MSHWWLARSVVHWSHSTLEAYMVVTTLGCTGQEIVFWFIESLGTRDISLKQEKAGQNGRMPHPVSTWYETRVNEVRRMRTAIATLSRVCTTLRCRHPSLVNPFGKTWTGAMLAFRTALEWRSVAMTTPGQRSKRGRHRRMYETSPTHAWNHN